MATCAISTRSPHDSVATTLPRAYDGDNGAWDFTKGLTVAAAREQQAIPAFGHLLRQHRTLAGLSQEALAEQSGISTRAVSDLERGVKTRPHPATMRLLADALHLGPEDRAALAQASRPATALPSPEPLAARSTLPLPHTSFVGREAERDLAAEMLQAGNIRLLTLTGPGGVGKTRLSLEIARSIASEFPGGVAFVELAPVTDGTMVIAALAAALGLREDGERPLLEAVRAHLGTRRFLLVLDNCEHVLDAVRPVASRLLEGAPGLVILASSRAPLRLQGEQILPVPPLSLPERDHLPDAAGVDRIPALDLFQQRARAVRPDFAITPANINDVVDICARLDGLPLAIELAAARTRTLSPAALLGLLSARLRVLTTGPHDAPERQRSLRAAIDWSHDLLASEHQVLMRRVAVFAGGGTLESIAAVATGNDPFAALDGLDALVDQGLILRTETPTGDLRFGMLETVREYALEQLDVAGESRPIKAAHGTQMLTVVTNAEPMLQGLDATLWLDRLSAEQDNYRAALGWALGDDGDPALALRLAAALWPFWHRRGHLREGHAWLERAIAQGERVDPTARATAYLVLANIANNLEDHRRAHALYGQSLALFDELGLQGSVASTLVGLGMIATNQGEYDHAESTLGRALAIYTDIEENEASLPCVYALGRLAVARGDFEEANVRFADVIAMLHPDDVGSRAYCSLERALLERAVGNLDLAAELVSDCLVQFRGFGERRAEAAALAELGHIALARNNPHRAADHFAKAITIHLDLHDEFGAVRCLEGMAALAIQVQRPNLAATLLGTTDAWRRRTGTVRTLPERITIDQLRADCARSLGESRLMDATESGHTMAIDQAFALAEPTLSTAMSPPWDRSSTTDC